MLFSFAPVLLAAALAASAFAAPDVSPTRTTRDAYADVNPVGIVTRSLALKPPLTNAQRFARGLPPNRPRRGYDARRALAPRQSSTPCVVQATGKIQLYSGSNLFGYLSHTVNSYGQYRSTTDESQGLVINVCQNNAGGTHDIYVQNGLANYPFLGLVSGAVNTNNNFSPTSYNYAYIAGTGQTPYGVPAVSGPNSFDAATRRTDRIQSNVWALGSDNQLTASWVNLDGSRINTVIVRSVSGSEDNFIVTAGYAQFVDMFGPSSIFIFRFVPDSE